MRDFFMLIFNNYILFIKINLTNGTTKWTKKNNFGQSLFQTLQ